MLPVCECTSIDDSPWGLHTVLQFPRPCGSRNVTGPSELPWEPGGVGCADLSVYAIVKYYICLPRCKEWQKEKCEKTEAKGEKVPPDPNMIRTVARCLVPCKSCALGLGSLEGPRLLPPLFL